MSDKLKGLVLIGANQDTDPIFDEASNATLLMVVDDTQVWDPNEYKSKLHVELKLEQLLSSIHMKVVACLISTGIDARNAIWMVFRDVENIAAMEAVGADWYKIANAVVNKEENGRW